MKKLAIASAIALMGMGSAFAQEVVINTPQPQVAGLFQAGNLGTVVTDVGTGNITTTVTTAAKIDDISGVTTALFGTSGTGGLLNNLATVTTVTDVDTGAVTRTGGYDIAVLSGAINLARVNGAIDISGTNVSLSSLANNVSATATATAITSTADAYAIAGAKLSTTVIGAMNSATVEIMGKTTDQSNAIGQQTGLASLAAQDMTKINVGTSDLDIASLTNGLNGSGNLGNAIGGGLLFDATSSNGQLDMSGLTSAITASTTNKISELQSTAVFNTAINAAALDAGIKVVASVDPNAWFLNPQTGVVNLSNVAISTTAIGAMNSSVTRLGANLSTPTVTVK